MNAFTDAINSVLKTVATRGVNLNKHFNSAIIVAAGNGVRMGICNAQTKQMTELDGLPVIVRTIMQFDACDFINEIIVVAREDEAARYDEFAAKYNIKKIARVVVGGDTRQKSAMSGLKAVSDKAEFIAIHDGARCLVTPEMIAAVLTGAYIHGSATAAERPKDTIKKAAQRDFISETIDRSELWHAQTPQVFKADIYRAAAYIALENGTQGTDDCMLVEQLGFKIKLIDCGYENLKITTPDDFYLASAILRLRRDREIGELCNAKA